MSRPFRLFLYLLAAFVVYVGIKAYYSRPHGHVRAYPMAENSSIERLAFAPDGHTFAAVTQHGEITLWDVDGKEPHHRFNWYAGAYFALQFSPDGQRLLVAGPGAVVIDLPTGEQLLHVDSKVCDVWSAAFSPDGACILVASDEVSLWDISSQRRVWTMLSEPDTQHYVAFSPDGTRVLVATGHLWSSTPPSISLRVFNASTQELLGTLEVGHNALYGMAAAHNNPWVVLLTEGQTPLVNWNSLRIERLFECRRADDAAFTRNDEHVALVADYTKFHWVNAADGRLLKTTHAFDAARSVAVSPDGRWAVSGGHFGSLLLWSLKD